MRAYTRMLLRRGQLLPLPCVVCGGVDGLTPHHLRYDGPSGIAARLVLWLCADDHRAFDAPA